MGRTLHEVFRIREVRDHRTGGTVVALNPPDTGSNRDPEIEPRRRSPHHVATSGGNRRTGIKEAGAPGVAWTRQGQYEDNEGCALGGAKVSPRSRLHLAAGGA